MADEKSPNESNDRATGPGPECHPRWGSQHARYRRRAVYRDHAGQEHWEHWHEFHHYCGRRVRHYVGAHMHRRIFAWLGAAIVVTGLVVMFTMHALSDGQSGWRAETQRIERFVGERYARVWSDPAARDEFSRALTHDLDLGVALHDARGGDLARYDWPDRCRWATSVPVIDRGIPAGNVEFCLDKHHPRPAWWRLALALGLAFAMLWAMAGKIARRIAQPLRELTRVAREIGEGNLASRSRLPHALRGEVGHLSDAVNEMATRIERQLRDQRELLAAVSHELRTPLARVRILLEMARDGAGVKDPLGEIESEVLEMDSLVGDLLASSRIDFSAMSPRVLAPDEIASRAVERASIPSARLELDPRVGPVVADATLLSRALAALLDNAKKHGGERVILRVESGTDGGVRFLVDDDGPGFAPGEETRALEPFHRGPERKPGESAGLGLGLSLVRRIAEAHGGRAFAGNRPEGGARVGLELPARSLEA